MGQTAIVTGGSGGIGRACVRQLTPEMDVLIGYHTDANSAESLADEVSDLGCDTTTYRCDISSREEVRSMVDHARSEFGTIDVLVNNAGELLEAPVAEMTPEHITHMLSVNLMGAMYCTQAVLPEMRDRGEGWIVNVSSTGGTRGGATSPAYSAAKGGMVAFTKSTARRYTVDGIRANVVAPSSTDTDMFPDDRRDAAAAAFPQGRMVRPEEVAEAVRFFATASYVSGKVLEIDGGRYT